MRSPLIVSLFAVTTLLAGCGEETPTDYSAENREAFLAACVDDSVDGLFPQRICQCVYDEAESTIAFERFAEIEEQLSGNETTPLPDDLLDLVAHCVIEEGDL